MTDAAATEAFEQLRRDIARAGDPSRRAEVLICGLADAVKAISNDQNVQKLARELRVSAASMAVAIVG